MNDTQATRDNKTCYGDPQVVEHYARANYLTAAEQALFAKYHRPGMRILDLGVGGGRTSGFLAHAAQQYTGIDFAADMIEKCRQRFPALDFRTMDAADLSAFASDHFDLVVFSFNGLGCLHPDAQRARCLAECRRVLKDGGVFIFSLHHARSLLYRMPVGQGMRPLPGWLLRSVLRALRRLLLPAFWRGEGYFTVKDIRHAIYYSTTPQRVQNMLAQAGFKLLDVVGDDHPLPNIACMTRWYYYAAGK